MSDANDYISLRVPWPKGKVPTDVERRYLRHLLSDALDRHLQLEAIEAGLEQISLEPCEECDDV